MRDFLKKAEKTNEEPTWENEDSDGSVNIDLGAAAAAIKMFKDRKKQ